MIAPTGILLLAVLATAQRPVTKRPVPPPVGPKVVVPPAAIPPVVLTPVAPGTPLSSFQGTWLGPGTDSASRRMVRVDGLHIRLSEVCLPAGGGQCEYDGDAVAYRAPGAAPNDSNVAALAVEYGGTQWHRFLILRQAASGRLEAFVYTRFTGSTGRGNVYEHQLLSRVSFMKAGPGLLPQFPWPPPPATATLRLPDSLVAIPERHSLGTVYDRIRAALATNGYVGMWSVYGIGADGFAIVTKLEAIEREGSPKAGDARWSGPNDQLPPRITGIGDYLKALFSARPGFYRVIVFAVTDRPSQSAGAPLSADSASKLLSGGSDELPTWLRQVPLGVDGRCLVLIYEFVKPSESDTARFFAGGPPAVRQLALTGLWTEQQLVK